MNNKIKLPDLYNVRNIRLFLSIFDLDIMDCDLENVVSSLPIYADDIEVGKVEFLKDGILLSVLSKYGRIDASTKYAEAFTLTDMESYCTIGCMGLYGKWHNDFEFSMKLLNGNVFSGNMSFGVQVDNEFGNRITPHFRLHYKECEKEYDISFQEHGIPFQFIEKRGAFMEKILYPLFDTAICGSYLHHSKRDQFSFDQQTYAYEERYFVSGVWSGDRRWAVTHKEFGANVVAHDYCEFVSSKEKTETDHIIQNGNFMKLIDPSCVARIHTLIEEFSIDGDSFLEKIFLYGFQNFSREEVYALFALEKKDTDLLKIYFGNIAHPKRLEKDIFHRMTNGSCL